MNSCQCVKSELSLFDKSPVQTVILKGNFEEVYPIHPISGNDAPIEFLATSSDSDMFDLNDSMLEVRGKVLYSDDTDITDGNVKPVALTLNSLFADMSIFLNEHKLEGGHFLYPYQSYFINMLQTSSKYKKCQLDAAGFDSKHVDIENSREFQYIGSLNSEFFSQGRYLLNQSTIRLKLTRHKAQFCLLNTATLPVGKAGYKIKLTKAILHMRRCQINPSVLYGHEQGLIKQPAVYPIQHVEMITYTVAAGINSLSQDNIFSGQSPKLIVFGMVTNEAFNGTIKSNPFQFEHFDLSIATLSVNGEPITTQMDFKNKLCKRQYMAMFQSLEMYNTTDESNGLTYEKWLNGNTLFVYNLCPDLAFDGEHGQVKSRPNIRLELQFEKSLSKSINIVMMSLTDGLITIDKNREVTVSH